jgi:4-hydroxybenzoate polyprenyltransferase
VQKFFAFITSIRPVNLIIIILTQCLVRYCIILPAYEVEKNYTGLYPLHMSEEYFFLLVLTTVLIAAAGYILNDNMDASLDAINKPRKKSFAANISRSSAINIYIILTSIAVAIAFFIADSILNFWLGFVQVGSSVLLALYSGVLKKIPFVGNVTVALLSALVPAIAGLYEPSFYPNFTPYISIYSGFAFLISLIREIVKDAEDMEGDKISGRKTIPLALGMSTTKVILTVLIVLTALGAGKVVYDFFYSYTVYSFWKILTAFEIPLLLLLGLALRAREKKDFSLLSTSLKIFMLLGILTMVPLYHLITS